MMTVCRVGGCGGRGGALHLGRLQLWEAWPRAYVSGGSERRSGDVRTDGLDRGTCPQKKRWIDAEPLLFASER